MCGKQDDNIRRKSTINNYDCKLSNYSSMLFESIGIRMKSKRAVVPSMLRTIGDLNRIESGMPYERKCIRDF